MIKKISLSKKIKVAVLMTGLFAIGCHFTQQTFPEDAAGSCLTGPEALTSAEFNSWFESGTVSLNGVVKPANSVLFPNVDDCQFFKWSQQMFLWLTSPAKGKYGKGGIVMNSPVFYDVSHVDESGKRHFISHTPGLVRAFNVRTAQRGLLDLPVILEKKSLRMLEILPPVLSPTGKQLITDDKGNEIEIGSIKVNERGQHVLVDNSGKEIQRPKAMIQSVKDTILSPVSKKLTKMTNFDRTALVQKISIGKITSFLDLFGNFHDIEQGQADGSVLMAQNGSLVYYSVTVNNVYALFRTMQGATVADGTKFPTTAGALDTISNYAKRHGQFSLIDSIALALEIKASWVEAKGLADADKFIKMKAVVPKYTKTSTEWIPNGTRTIELALVGMHVVGSAAGNPEMLWSTFEHVSNDPPAGYMYRNASGTDTSVPQNTAGNWIFCADRAEAPFNEAHMIMNDDRIVALAGHTIGPSNIRREMPWGINGFQLPGLNSQMIVINNVTRSLLNPDDVRRNYFQVGTTWTIAGSAPGTLGPELGTNILSNTTMETFVQPSNCFTCHRTNTTVVSHIFNDIEPLF